MQRYADNRSALTKALDLMVEEGDIQLVAVIAHALQLAERRMLRGQINVIGATHPIAARTGV